jgi:hypothetical protein
MEPVFHSNGEFCLPADLAILIQVLSDRFRRFRPFDRIQVDVDRRASSVQSIQPTTSGERTHDDTDISIDE